MTYYSFRSLTDSNGTVKSGWLFPLTTKNDLINYFKDKSNINLVINVNKRKADVDDNLEDENEKSKKVK